ncbi:MAG: dihydropteroate synthase [Treponema sp.]|nr:dihydropteroate synthase [Treponema sp.]
MRKRELKLAQRTIETERPAFVMGIVNCTPDSFYPESRGNQELAFKLIDEGADILDLGAESTRPGAAYVDEKEEIERIVPVIREIRKHSDIPISIDTRKKNVMKAAFEEGADILNDVSALEDDPEIASYAAEKRIPVILMHKRGSSENMQDYTYYEDIFQEVNSYLQGRVDYALISGIQQEKIIIDPGIGFAKNLEGNIELIKKCGSLCNGKYPVLMALSRKSCIGQITGREVGERLYGTLAANLFSLLYGASIVRVHDVAPCVDTFNVMNALGIESGILCSTERKQEF